MPREDKPLHWIQAHGLCPWLGTGGYLVSPILELFLGTQDGQPTPNIPAAWMEDLWIACCLRCAACCTWKALKSSSSRAMSPRKAAREKRRGRGPSESSCPALRILPHGPLSSFNPQPPSEEEEGQWGTGCEHLLETLAHFLVGIPAKLMPSPYQMRTQSCYLFHYPEANT